MSFKLHQKKEQTNNVQEAEDTVLSRTTSHLGEQLSQEV